MAISLKARRFTTLQMLFAATVFLMVVKAVALRNHLTVSDWPRTFGAQSAAEQDEQVVADEEIEGLTHDGEWAATEGE